MMYLRKRRETTTVIPQEFASQTRHDQWQYQEIL